MSRRRKSNPFTLFSFQDIITSVMGIMLLSALILAVELVTRPTTTSTNDGARSALKHVASMIEDVRADLQRLTNDLKAAAQDAEAAAVQILADAPHRLKLAKDRVRRLNAEAAEIKRAVRSAEDDVIYLQREKLDRREEAAALEAKERDLNRLRAELEKMRVDNRLFFRLAAGSTKLPWLIDFAEHRILLGPIPPSNGTTPPRAAKSFHDSADLLSYLKALSPTQNSFVIFVRPTGVAKYRDLIDGMREKGYELGFDVLPADRLIFAETP